MSPCMAAMNGSPPNRYGFHWGIRPWARKYSAPKCRKVYPAMYWSSPSRNFPPSIGQQTVSIASTKTANARSAGREGSKLSPGRGVESERNTRTPPGEEKERGRRAELGEREQHAGREGEHGRRRQAKRG